MIRHVFFPMGRRPAVISSVSDLITRSQIARRSSSALRVPTAGRIITWLDQPPIRTLLEPLLVRCHSRLQAVILGGAIGFTWLAITMEPIGNCTAMAGRPRPPQAALAA